MRILAAILFLCIGCAVHPQLAPPPMPPVPKAFVRQSQDVIEPPPPAVPIVLHFTYPIALLTNGYLVATMDFQRWYQPAYALATNGDVVGWWVTNDFSKPCEFFRAGGETIQ